VLEHVPDPLTSLKQINDLLAPGGKLILCVPYECGRDYARFKSDDIHRHLYSWNPRSIGNLLSEAGFTVNDAYIGPYGYEQRLAPLAKYGFAIYRFGLAMVRVVKPFREVVAIAEKAMDK
jgi:SAM-dependent methyltransferase